MLTHIATRAAAFRSNTEGTAGVLFALLCVAVFFLAGMAIDYGRILDVRNKLTAAVDAAALAAGRAMLDGQMSDNEIVRLAQTYFTENTRKISKAGTIGVPTIAVDRERGSVNISALATVAMTLTRLGGIRNVNVPVTTEAVFEQKDIEVGMALDITGSMYDRPRAGGPRKIESLKLAFESFAERLLPEERSVSRKVRIGLAPYSASINLGSYADAASLGRSSDGCVTERSGGAESDDAAPSGPYGGRRPVTGAFRVETDGNRDIDTAEGIPGGSAYTCPRATLTPLSDQRQTLVDTVNAYDTGGWTAGHIGAQWAWNLISDQWGSTWGGDSQPDTYTRVEQNRLIKAVVLMTDGSFNTAYSNGASSRQAIDLCTEMKAKGVVVFSVAFDAPSAAKETLEQCASPGIDYYADASNEAELEAAFNKFASKLSELRLAK